MKSKDQKVAFVVVCWNNQPLLKECFDSIRSQTHHNWEIIMVDNASEDSSVSFTKRNYPEVEIIQAESNLKFAKGNNLGIEKALEDDRCRYIVLLNTDATLKEDWLETLITFDLEHEKVAAMQSVTLDYYDHGTIDSTNIYVAENGQATQANYRRKYSYPARTRAVFGANAAAAVFTRAFLEAQPFKDYLDAEMEMYLEDVDFAARAVVSGWSNYLVSGTEAYHMGSASSGKNRSFPLRMTYRNNALMLFKNFPLRTVITMIPRAFLADIRMIRAMNRAGEKSLKWDIVRGRLSSILLLPKFVGKKMKMNKLRKGTDIERVKVFMSEFYNEEYPFQ